MKVAVVTPIPTPYRDPFWEEFGGRKDVSLTVIYCAGAKADRPWGDLAKAENFRSEFPKSKNLTGGLGWGYSCFWNPEVVQILRELEPDVVLVGGYTHLTMLRAIRYCRKNQIPWVLMSESWKQRAGIKGTLKHRFLRKLLRTASGGLPTGSLASGQLQRLGIKPERQNLLPNVPDIARLLTESKSVRIDAVSLRRELGMTSDQRVVLFAARLIPKKRPLMVVESFAKLNTDDTLQLVMLGDGPLRQDVERRCEELGISKQVRFEGFVAPDLVQKWMSIADVFVQPSWETWGVAPIEAAACGCRVIVSNEIGCYADVFATAANHRVLKHADETALAEAISELISDDKTSRSAPDTCHLWLQNNTFAQLSTKLASFLTQIVHEKSNSFASTVG